MDDRLLFMLSKVRNKLTTHMRRELKDNNVALSPGQIGILFVLDQEKQTTMGHLSRTLDIDNAAISRLVDKLEQQGLVQRRINPDDRRVMLIAVTAQGINKAALVKKVARATNQKIKEGFTAEEMDIYKRINVAIIQKFG